MPTNRDNIETFLVSATLKYNNGRYDAEGTLTTAANETERRLPRVESENGDKKGSTESQGITPTPDRSVNKKGFAFSRSKTSVAAKQTLFSTGSIIGVESTAPQTHDSGSSLPGRVLSKIFHNVATDYKILVTGDADGKLLIAKVLFVHIPFLLFYLFVTFVICNASFTLFT